MSRRNPLRGVEWNPLPQDVPCIVQFLHLPFVSVCKRSAPWSALCSTGFFVFEISHSPEDRAILPPLLDAIRLHQMRIEPPSWSLALLLQFQSRLLVPSCRMRLRPHFLEGRRGHFHHRSCCCQTPKALLCVIRPAPLRQSTGLAKSTISGGAL